MSVLIALGLLVLGTVLLLWGADWLLDGVRDLARRLEISALVLGVLLVGLEPEEMLTAAWASGADAGRLALADVIGTNITIVTLALGLSALVVPLVLDRSMRRQALLTTLIVLPPLIVLVLGPINRIIGALLLLLFVIYILILLRTDRKAMERLTAAEIGAEDDEDASIQDQQMPLWRLILLSVGGLMALAVGGPVLVRGALQLAGAIGFDQEVIGVTIVALGTGAEMIALGIAAARKRQVDILMGGILGSFAYNLLVTLGLAALVRPLPALPPFLRWALGLMIIVYLLLLLLIWRGKMGRLVGVLFVAIYGLSLIAAIVSGILLAH